MIKRTRVRHSKLLAALAALCLALPIQADKAFKYTTFTDTARHFTVDLPAHWQSESKGQSIIFSGSPDSQEWQTTINFQVIKTAQQDLSSVVNDLKNQWRTHDASYRLLEEQTGLLDDHRANRLLVEYRDKQQKRFQQEQFVALYPGYYYLMAYTAPADQFNQYHAAMDKALETFHVLINGETKAGMPQPGKRQPLPDQPLTATTEPKAINPQPGLEIKEAKRLSESVSEPQSDNQANFKIRQNATIDYVLWPIENPNSKISGTFRIKAGEVSIADQHTIPEVTEKTETGSYSCAEKATKSKGFGHLQGKVISIQSSGSHVEPWRCTEIGQRHGEAFQCESAQTYTWESEQKITFNHDGTLQADFVMVTHSTSKTWGNNCLWQDSDETSAPQSRQSVGTWQLRQ